MTSVPKYNAANVHQPTVEDEPESTRSKELGAQSFKVFVQNYANHLRTTSPLSIGLPPKKMARFYVSTGGDSHMISLFKTASYEKISEMYIRLGCGHFLGQPDKSSPCAIPELTPDGFHDWMLLQFSVDPDKEKKRLKAVSSGIEINFPSPADESRNIFNGVYENMFGGPKHTPTSISKSGKAHVHQESLPQRHQQKHAATPGFPKETIVTKTGPKVKERSVTFRRVLD